MTFEEENRLVELMKEAYRSVLLSTEFVTLGQVLNMIQADPHIWSSRPCPTCRTVSALAGRPFGCNTLAKSKKE